MDDVEVAVSGVEPHGQGMEMFVEGVRIESTEIARQLLQCAASPEQYRRWLVGCMLKTLTILFRFVEQGDFAGALERTERLVAALIALQADRAANPEEWEEFDRERKR